MTRRSSAPRRCPICRIQRSLCFCAELTPIATRTRVTILMHYREQFLTSNTASLAHRMLTNSSLQLRGEREPLAIRLLADHVPLFLFPDEEAIVLTPERVASLGAPVQLIVPDGSWRQTRTFKRREPLLRGLPSVALSPATASRYRLRQPSHDGGLCTYEAISAALELLEGAASVEPLARVLEVMVERTLQARAGGPGSRPSQGQLAPAAARSATR